MIPIKTWHYGGECLDITHLLLYRITQSSTLVILPRKHDDVSLIVFFQNLIILLDKINNNYLAVFTAKSKVDIS